MEVQSYTNLYNSNNLQQTITANGSTDLFTRKIALARNEAEIRYRKLIKMAESRNQEIKNYCLQAHGKSIEDYCGDNFIIDRVSTNNCIGMNTAQAKFFRNYKSNVVLPLGINMKTYQMMVQALVFAGTMNAGHKNQYRQYRTVIYNKYTKKMHLNSVTSQRSFQPYSYSTFTRQRYGLEHILSPFYKLISDDDANYFVNVVDYINIYMSIFVEDFTKLINFGHECEVKKFSYKKCLARFYGLQKLSDGSQAYYASQSLEECIQHMFNTVYVNHNNADEFTNLFQITEQKVRNYIIENKNNYSLHDSSIISDGMYIETNYVKEIPMGSSKSIFLLTNQSK